jgi:GAF domain-containing protein
VIGNPALDGALDALVLAQDLPEVQRIVRTAARRAVAAQGATLVLRDGDQCFYADEDAISPLWKGQRFPLEQCISGWAMLHHRPAVVPDIRVDPRIPQAAYRPTFVRALAMVPIGTSRPIGAIGAYWARPHHAGDHEVDALARLAEATAPALTQFLPATA